MIERKKTIRENIERYTAAVRNQDRTINRALEELRRLERGGICVDPTVIADLEELTTNTGEHNGTGKPNGNPPATHSRGR
jgi:membrane-anchored protein YejM (alkaline phosphatase superfamily)